MAIKKINILCFILAQALSLVASDDFFKFPTLHSSVVSDNSISTMDCECGSDLDDLQPAPQIIRINDKDIPTIVDVLNRGLLNPNKQNKNGISLLHRVVKVENFDVVKILLQFGAQVNMCDKWGTTALHFACMQQPVNKQLIAVLLDAGANVQAKSTHYDFVQTPTPQDMVAFQKDLYTIALFERYRDYHS